MHHGIRVLKIMWLLTHWWNTCLLNLRNLPRQTLKLAPSDGQERSVFWGNFFFPPKKFDSEVRSTSFSPLERQAFGRFSGVFCRLLIGKVPRFFQLNVRLVGHFLANTVLRLIPIKQEKVQSWSLGFIATFLWKIFWGLFQLNFFEIVGNPVQGRQKSVILDYNLFSFTASLPFTDRGWSERRRRGTRRSFIAAKIWWSGRPFVKIQCVWCTKSWLCSVVLYSAGLQWIISAVYQRACVPHIKINMLSESSRNRDASAISLKTVWHNFHACVWRHRDLLVLHSGNPLSHRAWRTA